MNSRIIIKTLIIILAMVFAYSYLYVGIMEGDVLKIIGGSISLLLGFAATISLFYEFKK
jgi:hypothetical protein